MVGRSVSALAIGFAIGLSLGAIALLRRRPDDYDPYAEAQWDPYLYSYAVSS